MSEHEFTCPVCGSHDDGWQRLSGLHYDPDNTCEKSLSIELGYCNDCGEIFDIEEV